MFKLYIPHGSDNTSSYEALLFTIAIFISHMVQIIRANAVANVTSVPYFISHMVQIIRYRHK
mgnify:CR=1 FL=1